MWKKQKADPTAERDHRTISVIAGICWKALPPEEKKVYQLRAVHEKELHAAQNPGYKYAPVVRREKPIKRRNRNDPHNERERCHRVASVWMEHFQKSSPAASSSSSSSSFSSSSSQHFTPRSLALSKPLDDPSGCYPSDPAPDPYFDLSSPFNHPPANTEMHHFGQAFEPEFTHSFPPMNATSLYPSQKEYNGIHPPHPFHNFDLTPQTTLDDNGWALFELPYMNYGPQLAGPNYSPVPNPAFESTELDFGAWFKLE